LKETFSIKNKIILKYFRKIGSKIILFIVFLLIINIKKTIKIDNLIIESSYQNDIDYSHFTNNYKVVVIFYIQNHIIQKHFIKEKKILSPIKEKEKNNSFKSILSIKEKAKLAKNHGLFGFGIVYNLIQGVAFNEEILNSFLYNKVINFPFFIILDKIDEYIQNNQSFLIKKEEYNEKYLIKLYKNIEKFFDDENYIKLGGKPILGIFHSDFSQNFIDYIKENEKNKKKRIFIIKIFKGNKKSDLEYKNSSNSYIEFPSQDFGFNKNLAKKYFYNFYYNNLFEEENNKTENIKNFFIVNGCFPNKFYIIFKKYLTSFKDNNTFLLFNAWNNYQENTYLEPDKIFGFSYLNYLSKAIFNIDDVFKYDLENLKNKCKIAVQVHLFYEDLINDIINKTNNIPVKFDLYISIVSSEIKKNLTNFINSYSKANYFEILIVKNRGRDILPLLKQIKTKTRIYKYLCHIHTKKSKTNPKIGSLWRDYLFDNLLGNVNLVSEILNDFETNKKLGFIFPETFYGIINQFCLLSNGTKKYMDFLASILFPNCILGDLLYFPAGNMFWSKISAIFQIFNYDFSKYFSNEENQINDTIMHGIERIWLYLVKFNHFYFKVIFKHF